MHIVALTGAGISAESGLNTFRDAGGLWEGHDVMEVASLPGWIKNPKLVLDFYNQRRKANLEAAPNAGHLALKSLEESFRVSIITQNVDTLHERAGSSNILHLHGRLDLSRSSSYPSKTYPVDGWELNLGDTCENGSQLRPHIVWFGEEVPMLKEAIPLVASADMLLIIGTSLQVYPAANLVHYAPAACPKYYIDPKAQPQPGLANLEVVRGKAGEVLPELANGWLKMAQR